MGEGISAGMESVDCAAHAIANHFDTLDMIYADYQRYTQQLKSCMERQWNFVGRKKQRLLHSGKTAPIRLIGLPRQWQSRQWVDTFPGISATCG